MSQNLQGQTRWTREQWAAITLEGELLVAAAAGSGKTAVLIERILRLITDPDHPVDVDRLLVVTFTNAAAREMKERMGLALEREIFQHGGQGTDHLLRQMNLLSRSHITTLHSFCLDLLRQYFYRLDLDPGFRVADEIEGELIRQDVLEELFEEKYEEEDPVFQQLVEALGSDRDDRGLMDWILKIYTFAYSQASPSLWLSSLVQAYSWTDPDNLLASPWGQTVVEGTLDELKTIRKDMDKARGLAMEGNGPAHYIPVLDQDLEGVDQLIYPLAKGEWSEFEGALARFSFASLPRGSKGGKDPEQEKLLREKAQAHRQTGKERLGALQERFAFPLEAQLPALAAMSSLVSGLANLVDEFACRYGQAKRARNLVDFTDMEHMALRLLEDDSPENPVRHYVQDQYHYVLVDEYQDINPAQERILQQVSRLERDQPNLFMVGDIKQSIYRFRMADPTLFLDKYRRFPHWQGEQPEPSKQLVIDLARNFRSRTEIIDGVNYLFRQIMTAELGEIPYDDQAALVCGATYPPPVTGVAGGPVEVHWIDRNAKVTDSWDERGGEEEPPEDQSRQSGTEEETGSGEDKETEGAREGEDLSAAYKEARLVARRIRRLVEHSELQVFDQTLKDYRPVRYRDIVILLRSYTAVAPAFAEELQAAGVPVYVSTRKGYFAATEVDIILSLLKVIDNPHLDISLAAVLRSFIVGLNGEELGYIRALLPEGDYYEALTLLAWAADAGENGSDDARDGTLDQPFSTVLRAYQSEWPRLLDRARETLNGYPPLGDKISQFWHSLQGWRTYSRRFSLSQLIWHLYQDTGYLAYVGTLPGGDKRQANLQLLYDRACRFEGSQYRGLFRFLRFLERFQSQSQDWGEAKLLGENEDVVRLMTVHSSKGLEFPVVFMVGLGRSFNQRSLQETILLHSQLGMGLPIMDLEHRVHYPSFIRQALREQLEKENLAEELRVLYVALTRAREKLFLYGTVKHLNEEAAAWPEREAAVRGSSFLDWIGPALSRDLDGELQDPSRWVIKLHHTLPAPFSPSLSPADQGEASDPEDRRSFWEQEVDFRLNWIYPHQADLDLPAKATVSELKRRLTWYMDEEQSPAGIKLPDIVQIRPKFLQTDPARPLSAPERGTALHTALQHLPLSRWQESWQYAQLSAHVQWVEDEIRRMTEEEILSHAQADSLDPAGIAAFLSSPVGERMLSAGEVRRETPFTLNLTLKGKNQPILVQGIIDALLINRENHRLEVLDYKTDHFSDPRQGEEELLRRYTFQLGVYALAAERLLRIPVEQCTIYSFALHKEIPIPRSLWESALALQLEEGFSG